MDFPAITHFLVNLQMCANCTYWLGMLTDCYSLLTISSIGAASSPDIPSSFCVWFLNPHSKCQSPLFLTGLLGKWVGESPLPIKLGKCKEATPAQHREQCKLVAAVLQSVFESCNFAAPQLWSTKDMDVTSALTSIVVCSLMLKQAALAPISH